MKIKTLLHWISFAVLAYIFAKAGFQKVTEDPYMTEGMRGIGFGRTGNLLIGWAELTGVLGLIGGILLPKIKPIATLWLWPFAIGALTVHWSYHHPFAEYYEALLVTIMPAIVLATDRHFSVGLGYKV